VLQFLIEEALLERVELEESFAKAREVERLESEGAVERSRGRLERVLEAQAAAD
jgi:hypothetical protein